MIELPEGITREVHELQVEWRWPKGTGPIIDDATYSGTSVRVDYLAATFLLDGTLTNVRASGPKVKKDGTDSAVRGSLRYSSEREIFGPALEAWWAAR